MARRMSCRDVGPDCDFVARGETAKTVEDLPKLINEASALALVGSRESGVSVQFAYDPEATPVLVDRVAAWAGGVESRGLVLAPVTAMLRRPEQEPARGR